MGEMTRRAFSATVGTALAGASLSQSADAHEAPADAACPRPHGPSVTWEWGALREVVVGCPFARIGTGMPRFYRNYTSPASLERAEAMIRAFPRMTLEQAVPEMYAAIAAQMEGAIALLRGLGIVVHQVRPLDEPEEAFLADLSWYGAMQAYPRDPMLVIGDRVIETAIYAPMRRKEKFALRRTLSDRLTQWGIDAVSLPEPLPGPEGPDGYPEGAYLEGGDVFVLGEDIYVGLTGNASSPEGARWLQAVLGPRYRVHTVRLSKKFLHLDCVLATPRPGLAIVCRDGFVDGLPRFLSGWKLIEVTALEAEESLATNVLVLDERTTLVAEETPAVAEALSKAGQRVLTTPFGAVFPWGGAFRCWHHPLVREGGGPPRHFGGW